MHTRAENVRSYYTALFIHRQLTLSRRRMFYNQTFFIVRPRIGGDGTAHLGQVCHRNNIR